jgi:hypothetical protein
MPGQRVSAKAKWVIGGGLLGIALMIAIAVIAIKSRRDNNDPDSKHPNNRPAVEMPKDPLAGSGENFALAFDGKTSFAEVPSLLFQGGPYTLEATVTPATVNPGNGLIIGLVRAGGVALEQSGDCWQGIYETIGVLGNTLSPANTAQAGQSVHLAFVWYGTEGALFVDGKKIPNATGPVAPPMTIPGMLIGSFLAQDGTLVRTFTGMIDEIRISKVARYDKNYAPQSRLDLDRSTIALYHCDEGQGNVLKDSSPNRYDAIITGAKWVKVENLTAKSPSTVLPASGS